MNTESGKCAKCGGKRFTTWEHDGFFGTDPCDICNPTGKEGLDNLLEETFRKGQKSMLPNPPSVPEPMKCPKCGVTMKVITNPIGYGCLRCDDCGRTIPPPKSEPMTPEGEGPYGSWSTRLPDDETISGVEGPGGVDVREANFPQDDEALAVLLNKVWRSRSAEVSALKAERNALRDALKELKTVVQKDLLPICQEHGGEVWMADAIRITSVFERVDLILAKTNVVRAALSPAPSQGEVKP
jgi:ssDNA-binding Zn-finger/Zn-ribbon topoisomerase 1